MRILVDEDVPVQINQGPTTHNVRTVQQMGWGSLDNGELLALSEGRFDVFITADKNLKHQQNLSGLNIAVLQLSTNKRRPIEGNFPRIRDAVDGLKPGDFVELRIP